MNRIKDNICKILCGMLFVIGAFLLILIGNLFINSISLYGIFTVLFIVTLILFYLGIKFYEDFFE